jgi:two-component system NarL family sensor kinase
MKSLSFKTKILLLVIIPLVVVSLLLTMLTVYQAKELGSRNVEKFSDMIFDLRRKELKNYTSLATSAIKHVYNKSNLDILKSQAEAKEIFRNLEFSEDGYFFVYDYDGVNVVHPKKPQLEGKNLFGFQDSNGVFLIQSLISKARLLEGGYTDYVWDKPSKGRDVDKIGHSVGLEEWKWMLGTGLYTDDLEDAVADIKAEVNKNITSTLTLITLLAAFCTIVVGLIGARFTMFEGNLADEKFQKLSKKAVESQEEERGRVSHELQKGINTALYAARSKLVNVAKESSTDKARAKEDFISAVSILDKTIQEIYRISGELRPEILDTKGLYSAITELSEKVSVENDVIVVFTQAGENKRLKADLETSIYRIVQEALNNIVDHSHSSEASIKINQTDRMLNLSIQDNGSGFNAKKVMEKGGKGSVGFTDIQVRTQSLGGYFHVFSTKEVGTLIRVTIPLQ